MPDKIQGGLYLLLRLFFVSSSFGFLFSFSLMGGADLPPKKLLISAGIFTDFDEKYLDHAMIDRLRMAEET
jgi:hypothetical protein